MPNNEQKTNKPKGPKLFTPEELQQLKAHEEERKKKMETDPEYRKRWEKLLETYNRLMPNHDSE